MKWPEVEVLHEKPMKCLEMKILHERENELSGMGSTSCKSNEMAEYEYT